MRASPLLIVSGWLHITLRSSLFLRVSLPCICFFFLEQPHTADVSSSPRLSGSLALTWQALLSASALSALRFENGSISPILRRFHVSVSVGSPNDWYSDQVELVVLWWVDGTPQLLCNIVDDNDRLAAIQEDQTARESWEASCTVRQSCQRTLTPSRALWMSVSFTRLVLLF